MSHVKMMSSAEKRGDFVQCPAPTLVFEPLLEKRSSTSAEMLRLAQEAAAAAIWEWDLRTEKLYLSAQNAWLYGVEGPKDASDAMIGVDYDIIASRIHPDDLRRIRRRRLEAMRDARDYDVEFRSKDPLEPSRWRWLHTYARFVFEEGATVPARVVGLTMDVTVRRAVEDALRISEERLHLALDSGDDGLWDWDLANDRMWISDGWLGRLGHDKEQLEFGSAFWDRFVHPDDRRRVSSAIRAHLNKQTPSVECEHRLTKADGSEIWVLTRGRVADRTGECEPKRIVGTQIDISSRKAAELRMQHMALHDALTGLPNRALFHDRLEQAVAQATRGKKCVVLACDLDRFKSVNDTLGHAAGDHLLRIVADRMTSVVRPYDTVARLGGDEFGVVVVDLDDKEVAQQLAERLVAAVGVPIDLDGTVVDVGMSVGLVYVANADVDAEELFKQADVALYEAKAAGRSTVVEFHSEVGARVCIRGLLGLDMKEALRRGDFSLDYQPVIDISTGAVTGFEALMRWHHPTHGKIGPYDFIPVAEENGLIIPLGNWAIHEACREASNWPSNIRVAVNVSAVQLRRDGLEATVVSALAESGLDPNRLKLEVTESVLMRDADGVLARLRCLQSLGVRIALDDFGTGFSSLSYLRRFPFDKIKIDRGFVREIADPDTAAIIRAVVSIGERLGMGIVAEGVETPEQLELVRSEGCTEVQGYLYARPMPPLEARRYLMEHARKVA